MEIVQQRVPGSPAPAILLPVLLLLLSIAAGDADRPQDTIAEEVRDAPPSRPGSTFSDSSGSPAGRGAIRPVSVTSGSSVGPAGRGAIRPVSVTSGSSVGSRDLANFPPRPASGTVGLAPRSEFAPSNSGIPNSSPPRPSSGMPKPPMASMMDDEEEDEDERDVSARTKSQIERPLSKSSVQKLDTGDVPRPGTAVKPPKGADLGMLDEELEDIGEESSDIVNASNRVSKAETQISAATGNSNGAVNILSPATSLGNQASIGSNAGFPPEILYGRFKRWNDMMQGRIDGLYNQVNGASSDLARNCYVNSKKYGLALGGIRNMLRDFEKSVDNFHRALMEYHAKGMAWVNATFDESHKMKWKEIDGETCIRVISSVPSSRTSESQCKEMCKGGCAGISYNPKRCLFCRDVDDLIEDGASTTHKKVYHSSSVNWQEAYKPPPSEIIALERYKGHGNMQNMRHHIRSGGITRKGHGYWGIIEDEDKKNKLKARAPLINDSPRQRSKSQGPHTFSLGKTVTKDKDAPLMKDGIPLPERLRKHPDVKRGSWKELDPNQRGKVDFPHFLAELKDQNPKKAKDLWNAIDTRQTGFITEVQFNTAKTRYKDDFKATVFVNPNKPNPNLKIKVGSFEQVDEANTGKVTKVMLANELKEPKEAGLMMKAIDVRGDGYIDKTEWNLALEHKVIDETYFVDPNTRKSYKIEHDGKRWTLEDPRVQKAMHTYIKAVTYMPPR